MNEVSGSDRSNGQGGAAAWVYRVLPLAGVVFPVLSIIGSRWDPWVTYSASAFAFLILTTWMYKEVWSSVTATVRTYKNEKVDVESSKKIKQRLESLSKQLSENYGNSPFYVGHRVSTDAPKTARMSYTHLRAMHGWCNQWLEKVRAEKRIETGDAQGLSVLLNECNFLAEECETVVRTYVQSSEVGDNDRSSVVIEWDATKDMFNGELQEWSRIFQAVNYDRGGKCFTEYRPLKQIG